MKSRTVQRLLTQSLLLACLVVCLGNPQAPKYVGWMWLWIVANIVVGGIFIAAEYRERRVSERS